MSDEILPKVPLFWMDGAHVMGVEITSDDEEAKQAIAKFDDSDWGKMEDEPHSHLLIGADSKSVVKSYFSLHILKAFVRLLSHVETEGCDPESFSMGLEMSLKQEGILKIRTAKRSYYLAPRKKECIDWIDSEIKLAGESSSKAQSPSAPPRPPKRGSEN